MSSHIQVCCRIRPLGTGESPSVKLVSQNVVQAQALSFKLDHAFDSDCSQKDVFCAVVRPMIVDSFKGFNCSLFSYGQTGSGKTHTLFGSPGEENRGIVPRSVLQIFETAEECLGSISVLVRMSVLEIYQEKLRDLLCVSNVNKRDARNPMRIREHADGSVWVEGLEEKIVSSPHEFERFMETATKKRIVGSHSMNNVSSRSHLCCILTLNQTIQASGEKMISKVHLIDLAGSEMVRKTDATGVRFEEAKHINKSLSALGNVINALSTASSANRKSFTADSTTQINDTVQSVALSKSLTGSLSKPSGQSKTHIPYRDSKLTRLLQNSLGGNAKTIIILNLSAAAEHVLESISTLKFGDRARQIQTRPQINKTLDDQNALKSLTLAHNEINELRKIIFEQEEEIFALREKRTGVAVQTLSNEDEAAVMTEKSDFPVAICEICRAFVPEKDCREPLQEALLSGLETKPDESKPPKVGLSFSDERASGDDSITGDDDENDENEYGDRCAVCGLNKEDTDQLLLDTGESLGEMFTCDGNCGDQFHVRCVGLVGEAGQYVLPEGEWFCTRCTVGSRGLGETTDTYLHKEQEEEQDNLEDGHMHTATENSLIIAKLRTDYNMMRKERNRVIFQWQQEKNIHKKMELRRKSVQQEADVELIEAQETIAHLQNKLEETEAERDRCSTLFQILMKEFQQRGTSVSYDDLLGARLVTDVLKETLSQSTKISTPIPSCADNDGSSDQVPAAAVSNLPVSDSSPGAKSRNSASAPHPVSPPHVSSAEIPKPWILRGEADRSSDVDNVVWRNTSIVDSSFAAGIHPGGESSKSSITIVGVLGPEAGIESIDDDEDFIPKTFTEKIAKEKSKFINPLKNRLKTLMKAVQDESGSIAEIRQKYQSKDISRNSVQANEH